MSPARRSTLVANLLGITTAFLCTVAAAQTAQITPLIHTLESHTPVSLEANGVPGAAVAIIHHGRVVYTHGFGVTNIETRTPVTPNTIFNVGSLSKTPTAWAVMNLVDQGKLHLDSPIDSYLTRWHLPKTSFDNSQVTVQRLLSHTSGLSNHDYHGWDPASPLPPIEDSLSGKTGTGEVTVVTAPDSGFHYSGANFALLSLAIEEQTHQPYAAYMHDHIFTPLGMFHTQYGLPTDRSALATPYDTFGKPLPSLRYNEFAAAGLTTTLHDLSLFAVTSLGNTHGLLKPSTLHLMQTSAVETKPVDPYGPHPGYGLGYTVRPDQFLGHTGVGHGGSNSGWESLLEVIPETGDGIVIMTNSSNGSAVINSILCDWRRWASPKASCPTIDVRIPLAHAYEEGGANAAVALYHQLQHKDPTHYEHVEWQVNTFAYQILSQKDLPGAIVLFRLNVEQFPDDANVYDSLGEALLKSGDKPGAILNYQKSLDLNPRNDNARRVLKSLQP